MNSCKNSQTTVRRGFGSTPIVLKKPHLRFSFKHVPKVDQMTVPSGPMFFGFSDTPTTAFGPQRLETTQFLQHQKLVSSRDPSALFWNLSCLSIGHRIRIPPKPMLQCHVEIAGRRLAAVDEVLTVRQAKSFATALSNRAKQEVLQA